MKVMKKLEKEYQLDKRTTSILERTELPEYFGEIEISIDRLNNLRSFILKDEAKNNVFIFKRDTNETEFRTTTSKKTKNIKKKELRPFFERFEKILGEDEYTSTEHVSFVRGKKKEITEIFQIGRYVSFLDTTTFTPNSTYENRTPKERKIKIRWDIKTIFFEGVDIFTEGYSPLNALLSENPQGEIEIEINNEYGMEENILALLKAMKKIGTNRAYVEKINKDLKRRGIRLLF